ncbi:hypothetical protein AD998_17570 [bacterium 336/3]|nr:hypothetical protein AD998_17570 [bacterium 336/3]
MTKNILFIFIIIFFSSCTERHQTFEKIVHTDIGYKIDSISMSLSELKNLKSLTKIRKKFKENRRVYKKIEPFIEYYFQEFSRRINGPALPEIKTEDNIVNDASGYQVIEEIIYNDSLDIENLKKQVDILKTDLLFIKQSFKDLPVQNHHFYELMQHQIIRIATLGITGFDSPISLNSMYEAIYSIEGILEFYKKYCDKNKKEMNVEFLDLSQKAIQYINKNNDFNTFNRLEFIKNYLMPLSILLEQEFQIVIKNTPNFNENKVFYGSLADLMQGKKLNADAFSPFTESRSNPEKIALGKVLFNEKSLSKNNNMSCATCHIAEKAFTDNKNTSITNIHSRSTNRNSPTLLYSSFQKSFFYDMRSQDLENQIENVIRNPEEFNLTPKEIKDKILENRSFIQMFKKAYPNKKEITFYEIKNAIASYIRSLMPFKSKIDNYFKGKSSLNVSEVQGFNLFTGKAKCATCHFIPLYNGTIPPWFNNTESEVIGVPKNVTWTNAIIDSDVGRYHLNKIEQLKHSFKTPTIRNIEKTSPYMHNGIYNSLEDVIKFYDLGGGNGIGMSLEYQTLPFDQLRLTEKEKQNLVNFLKTLNDE